MCPWPGAGSGPLLGRRHECRGTGLEKDSKRGWKWLSNHHMISNTVFLLLGSGGLPLPAASLSSNFKKRGKDDIGLMRNSCSKLLPLLSHIFL